MSPDLDLNPNRFGILNQRGFLPGPSPVEDAKEEFDFRWNILPLVWLDKLARNLPKILGAGKARNVIRKTLDKIKTSQWDRELLRLCRETDEPRALNYLMRTFSFLGHAWVWEDPENPMDHIPAGLARPWYIVAKKLGRPPVLSYASYALDNWRMIEEGPIALGNIGTLQNFLGGIDEDWFILVHVDIEAQAGTIPKSIAEALKCAAKTNARGLYKYLRRIADAEENMYKTLLRMTEHCDPYIYYNRVRPWIHGWKENPALPNGMIYEGVIEYGGQSQKFRGETGAQSSTIPLLDAFLEVEHAPNKFTEYLFEMRDYMPPPHRQFIEEVERLVKGGLSVKKLASADGLLNHQLQRCFHWLDKFRNKHLEYVFSFIDKQLQTSKANPTKVGTGGTPPIPYLKEHIKDTQKARLY